MQKSCRYPEHNRKGVQPSSKSGVSGKESITGSECPVKLGLSLEILVTFGGEPSYVDAAKRTPWTWIILHGNHLTVRMSLPNSSGFAFEGEGVGRLLSYPTGTKWPYSPVANLRKTSAESYPRMKVTPVVGRPGGCLTPGSGVD